jgi:hypothetical protein
VVGAKELTEYLEVRGYADAAQWVYRKGPAVGDWTTGELISLTEVRHVHALAMSKAWDVAPHPDATEQEGPGAFRRHGIKPFPGWHAATGLAMAESAMRLGPSTFRPLVPIAEMAEFMASHDLPNVPVTTSEGELIGLLVREDAERRVAALHKAGTLVEHHEFGDLGHGFGLGTGTSAQGWAADAIRFWERIMKRGS